MVTYDEQRKHDEGRRAPRIVRVQLAWIQTSDPPSEGVARTVDLSSQGVGIVTSRPASDGARMQLQLDIGEGLSLAAAGVVRYCRPEPTGGYRVGVEFDAPPQLVQPPKK